MAQNDSVFKPLTPEQMQGPFSGFLQPTHGQQQAAEAGPPVLAGKGTSLGYIANKFIQGAMEGRIKAFERSENEKWQRYQGFSGFVQNIMPSLTVEGQQYILSQLSQVMGAHGQEAAGGGTGKGKKGQKQSPDTYPSAGGKVLATGNASAGAEGAGVMHHVTNALKDLFTGMTGGPTPKGGIDVGGKQAEISAKLFDENGQIRPEFSRAGVVQSNLTEANRILDLHPPGTTIDVADKSIAGQMQRLLQYAPDQYAAMQAAMANRFPRGPQTPGQKYEWEMENRMLGSLGGGQPPGQAGAPQSNVGPPQRPVNARSMQAQGGAPGQPPPPPQAGGAPSGQPGPPNMADLYEQNFYVKRGAPPRTEGYLQSTSDPAKIMVAHTDPRFPGAYFDGDNVPISPDLVKQNSMGFVDKPYHPPRDPLQKIGIMVDEKGNKYWQMLDPVTGKYTRAPGTPYIPPNTASEMAQWRKDESFNRRESGEYDRYAMNVHNINSRWDAAAGRIDVNPDLTIDKPAAQRKNEERRERELKQAVTDRNQLLDILYKQAKKEFHQSGEDSGGKAVAVPDDVFNLVQIPGQTSGKKP